MINSPVMFDAVVVENRLGQEVTLGVKLIAMSARDYLFINAPENAPSSLVAKNAEHFARQLVTHFSLDPQKCDFVEVRDQNGMRELLRWRFEWVGSSALAARSQVVAKHSQQEFLTSVLMQGLEKLPSTPALEEVAFA